MKKLILLLMVLLYIGCIPTYQQSEIKDGMAVTTVQMQQSVIDSCATIVTDGKYVYVMKEGLATHKLVPITSDHIIIPAFLLGLLILMICGLFIIFITTLHHD